MRFSAPRHEVDPDTEARLALMYYRNQIVNATSVEELRGIRMDIARDTRLTFGEQARMLKYADTQISLVQLQHSEQI